MRAIELYRRASFLRREFNSFRFMQFGMADLMDRCAAVFAEASS